MPQAFFAADLHLGHKGVCKFLNDDGSKLRPWETPEEMDEAIIEKWNKVVTPCDKVYVGGDVVINRKSLQTLKRMNGKKHLIKGNHDIFRISEYMEHFYEVSACRVFSDFVFTHVPIHPQSLDRWKVNVHGHLHSHRVLREIPLSSGLIWPSHCVDPRYVCVSMEQIDYTPIHIDELRARIKLQQEQYDARFA